MKIVLVGANGTIGSIVEKSLAEEHEIIRAGRSDCDITLDMTEETSITSAFERIGTFDALVCTAGSVAFKPFDELSTLDWYTGIHSKMMGQINLARHAIPHLTSTGSVTLVSGVLSKRPI